MRQRFAFVGSPQKKQVKILLNCKRDAGNPILNTLSKTTSAIFSACKKPTGTYLQLQL